MLWQAFGRWGALGAASGPAGVPPTLQGAGSYAAVSSGTLSPGYPAGIANNDIAFIEVTARSATGATITIDTPSGWNVVSNTTVNGFVYFRHAVFWKRLDGSESGSVTITPTIAPNDCRQAQMTVWRGAVTTGDPYEGLGTNEGSSVNMTGAAVTTTGSGRTILHMGGHGGQATCSPASGWTELYDNQTASGTVEGGLHAYSKERTSSGTESSASHTLSSSHLWHVVSLAIIPA